MNYQEIKDFPCNAPKGSIAIVVPDGYVKPCCAFIHQTNDWLETSNLYHTKSFDDILTSHHWNNYEPNKHCVSCIEHEEAIDSHDGPSSLREHWNLEISDDTNKLEYMELALDFTCNMMCRMCGPRQSSKWNASPILKELQTFTKFDKAYYKKTTVLKEYSKQLMVNLNNTDLSNIKEVRLVGGEPLYSKNLPWFINLLKKQEHWKDIKIIIITNGSILPSKDLFEGFNCVEIDVSIDSIGNLATATRMKVPWETVDANIREMIKLYEVHIHTTVSLLNCNQMQPLINYRHNLNISPIDHTFSMLHGPKHLLLNLIPKEHRDKWITTHPRVNHMLEMEHQENPPESYRFLKAMEILDAESELSFRDVNPEIMEIMEKLVKGYRSDGKV